MMHCYAAASAERALSLSATKQRPSAGLLPCLDCPAGPHGSTVSDARPPCIDMSCSA